MNHPPDAQLVGYFDLDTSRFGFEPVKRPRTRRPKTRRTMGNQQQTVTVNRLTPNQRSAIDAMVPPAWIASLTKTTVSFTRGPVGANSSIVLELDKLIAEGRSLDGTLHQRRGHPIQPMQSVLRKVKAALA